MRSYISTLRLSFNTTVSVVAVQGLHNGSHFDPSINSGVEYVVASDLRFDNNQTNEMVVVVELLLLLL